MRRSAAGHAHQRAASNPTFKRRDGEKDVSAWREYPSRSVSDFQREHQQPGEALGLQPSWVRFQIDEETLELTDQRHTATDRYICGERWLRLDQHEENARWVWAPKSESFLNQDAARRPRLNDPSGANSLVSKS